MKVKNTIVIVQLEDGSFRQVLLSKKDSKTVLDVVSALSGNTLRVRPLVKHWHQTPLSVIHEQSGLVTD